MVDLSLFLLLLLLVECSAENPAPEVFR